VGGLARRRAGNSRSISGYEAMGDLLGVDEAADLGQGFGRAHRGEGAAADVERVEARSGLMVEARRPRRTGLVATATTQIVSDHRGHAMHDRVMPRGAVD